MRSRFLRLLGHILTALVLVALLSALALAQDAGTAPLVTAEAPPLPGWLVKAMPIIGLLVWEAWLGASKLIKPNSTLGIVWAVLSGIWSAAVKNKAETALLFVGLALGAGCATLSNSFNDLYCGKGRHSIPPDGKACTLAFFAMAGTIPADVVACAQPVSAACIDAVLATGASLAPCKPGCADTVGLRVTPLGKIGTAVLRANVVQALRTNGYPDAGK